MRPRIGSLCKSKTLSPTCCKGPIAGLFCLVIIHPQVFSQKNGGAKPWHVFLVRRIMVLGELPTGPFEWGPNSHSRGSGMGQLVTDSRFLTASPYSSQVHSTSPEGSSPFFEDKPWTVHRQDSSVGQDAHGAHVPRYWPLAGPSFSTPLSERHPGVAVETDCLLAFELLGLDWSWKRF
jgi:hypothetical protein